MRSGLPDAGPAIAVNAGTNASDNHRARVRVRANAIVDPMIERIMMTFPNELLPKLGRRRHTAVD